MKPAPCFMQRFFSARATFNPLFLIPAYFTTPMQRFFRLRPLIAVVFALTCALPSGFAQLSKHGLIWHFGNHAGLNFSSGAPVSFSSSAMDSYEGCSSYCDANGQLLFYSNGGGGVSSSVNGLRNGYIWNRNNQVMYDMGQTQGGGYSAAQGALVLPKPNTPGHYYQFTMDDNSNAVGPLFAGNRGLSYFEVDMSLNGGLGGVVAANVPVFVPAIESMAAVPNVNQQDFWVVAIDLNSQDFVVVPVTTNGIGQPQMQPRHSHDLNLIVIKISPDGHFLCAGNELYAFNAANGMLQYLTTLAISNYTLSFSPGSRYLYGLESETSATVVRYDLLSGSAEPPEEMLPNSVIFTFGGLMQLGPDGNIYFNEQLDEDFLSPVPTASLSVIRCPESSSPDVERSILKFPTDINNAGGLFTSLPSFADYIFATPPNAHDTLQVVICNSPVSLKASQTGTHYQWSTGDTTAQITVNAVGTYTVEVQTTCATDTTTFLVKSGGITVVITADPIKGDTCKALPLTLHAQGSTPAPFKWSDGSFGDSLVITEFGTYIVQLFSDCGVAADTFRLLKPQSDCCKPLYPNAFTPNGDGINDRFSAIFEQCDVEYVDFLVYDRWGELVFQGYEPTEQWDGLTLNGTEAQSDVYVYTLRYKRSDQREEHFEKGEVILLR